MIQTLESFVCRNKYDYATFVVLQRYDETKIDTRGGYFMLAIESSFGYGYANAWSHPGDAFYDFLCRCDKFYLSKKFCQGEQALPDWEETTVNIRRRILEMRRHGSMTAKDARAAWPHDKFDSETAFSQWDDCENRIGASHRRQVDCTHEFIAYKPPFRVQQFMALHKTFWPAFCEQLVAAKNARVPAVEAVI